MHASLTRPSRAWLRSRVRRILLPGSAAVLALWLAGCGALVTSTPPVQATYSTHVSTPAATPSAATPYYQETLQRPTTPSGWSTDPVCTFTPQGLIVKPTGGQSYICLAPAAPIADVGVTVVVQQLSGSADHAFGLAVRHSDPKSYYFFGIDGHGRYTFTVVINDVSHTVIPFTANTAIHQGVGAVNRLQVIAQGQHLTLFVNGTAVGEVTVSTFTSGTIGLRGIIDGQVRFSDLALISA